MSDKLHKLLANAGLGSRREMEKWIMDGRVSVNGRIAQLGDRAESSDSIRVDGKRIASNRLQTPNTRILMYHKPAGEVCTRFDPEGRPTVFERLPNINRGRWINIGRLDINTTGLMLFTNDGELANRLMHPSNEVEREYAVRVFGEIQPDMLQRLKDGVELEDGPARFDELVCKGGDGSNIWYHVVLKEGRNREVRRLWESQGLQVSRLTRIRYGDIYLPRDLPRKRWRELDQNSVISLMHAVGLDPYTISPGRRKSTTNFLRKRKKRYQVDDNPEN